MVGRCDTAWQRGIGRQNAADRYRHRRVPRPGPATAEQRVEHCPQGIDVGRDRRHLVPELFGGGIFDRHQRLCRAAGRRAAKQARDAEIKQPRPPALVDENIRRLQVAVNDQPRMGIGDRVTDFAE